MNKTQAIPIGSRSDDVTSVAPGYKQTLLLRIAIRNEWLQYYGIGFFLFRRERIHIPG